MAGVGGLKPAPLSDKVRLKKTMGSLGPEGKGSQVKPNRCENTDLAHTLFGCMCKKSRENRRKKEKDK